MRLIVDGVEKKAYLHSYHIGNKEYFVTDMNEYEVEPKSIELVRNGKA